MREENNDNGNVSGGKLVDTWGDTFLFRFTDTFHSLASSKIDIVLFALFAGGKNKQSADRHTHATRTDRQKSKN